MFVRSRKNHQGEWSQPQKHSPILVLRLPAPSADEWHTTSYATVDGLFVHFMLTHSRCGGKVRFIYWIESRGESLHVEHGEFDGFDSVSTVFAGIRLHWSRESEKVVVSDALAGRRDFDSLTIE